MSKAKQTILDKLLAEERKRRQREHKADERYFRSVMGKFARRFSLGKPVRGLMADTNMPFLEWDGLTIVFEERTRYRKGTEVVLGPPPFIVVTVMFGDGTVKHGVYVNDYDDELARCIAGHYPEGSDDQ